jgi:tetratricopeptide (TPR) repeat protein
MAKTLFERQEIFRRKKKEQRGLRIDMWLPDDQADKLANLKRWCDLKSGPQVILKLIQDAWSIEVKKAASNNHAEAQFQYALMWLERQTGNSITEAKTWFKKCYDQGYRIDATANNLGILACALGSYNDLKMAVDWLQQSAHLGNACAQFNLWKLYTMGWGVKCNDLQAAAYLQQSAEQGFTRPQRLLGVLYALGKGVPKDGEKAMEWLRRGRREDDKSCQKFLAKVLSTFPDDRYGIRNGPLAVTIAENLVRPRRSAEYLETLAAAYAEAGRFDDAIRTQQELLSKLKQKKSRSKYQDAAVKQSQDHLNSFLHKKPLRDKSLDIRWHYHL